MAVQLTEFYARGPCVHCGLEVQRIKLVQGGWGIPLATTPDSRYSGWLARNPPPCVKREDGQGHDLWIVPLDNNDELEEWLDE